MDLCDTERLCYSLGLLDTEVLLSVEKLVGNDSKRHLCLQCKLCVHIR